MRRIDNLIRSEISRVTMAAPPPPEFPYLFQRLGGGYQRDAPTITQMHTDKDSMGFMQLQIIRDHEVLILDGERDISNTLQHKQHNCRLQFEIFYFNKTNKNVITAIPKLVSVIIVT